MAGQVHHGRRARGGRGARLAIESRSGRGRAQRRWPKQEGPVSSRAHAWTARDACAGGVEGAPVIAWFVRVCCTHRPVSIAVFAARAAARVHARPRIAERALARRRAPAPTEQRRSPTRPTCRRPSAAALAPTRLSADAPRLSISDRCRRHKPDPNPPSPRPIPLLTSALSAWSAPASAHGAASAKAARSADRSWRADRKKYSADLTWSASRLTMARASLRCNRAHRPRNACTHRPTRARVLPTASAAADRCASTCAPGVRLPGFSPRAYRQLCRRKRPSAVVSLAPPKKPTFSRSARWRTDVRTLAGLRGGRQHAHLSTDHESAQRVPQFICELFQHRQRQVAHDCVA